jgi:hypothetical protein
MTIFVKTNINLIILMFVEDAKKKRDVVLCCLTIENYRNVKKHFIFRWKYVSLPYVNNVDFVRRHGISCGTFGSCCKNWFSYLQILGELKPHLFLAALISVRNFKMLNFLHFLEEQTQKKIKKFVAKKTKFKIANMKAHRKRWAPY